MKNVRKIVSKEEKENSILLVFIKMFGEMFKAIPFMAIFFIICDVVHAAASVLIIVFSQRLFDGVASIAGGAPLTVVFGPLILFLLFSILLEVSNGLANFHYEYLSPTVLSRLYLNLYKKVERISPINFEKPYFLDMMNKAREGVESGYLAMLLALSIFTFYMPYYIFLGIYLRNLSPLLILSLIFVFIPVILGQAIRFKLFAQVEEDAAPVRRSMEYYEKAICDREYFKETRLLGAYTYFINQFRSAIILLNKKTLAAEIKHVRIDLVLRLLTIIGYMGILGILVRELLIGNVSAGAFAAVFAGIGMMYSYAEEVFGSTLRYVSRYAVSIRNYQKFLDFPERRDESTCFENSNEKKGISIRNVSFHYPGSDKEALSDVSLDIIPGETIAIVGENGAGKSTLMKLIMGIYEPTSGTIIVEGIDSSKVQYAYKACSAVFQKFQRYQLSLLENISISDINKNIEKSDVINNICNKVDLLIEKDSFPNEQDTMLSREFGGVDLSGGQWQRVAIARGLYRTHNVIILDEPTSAIDPIEETRLYNQFAKVSAGKTSIIITHRLGAARLANRIIVLRDGMIEEIGTHDQLIRNGGMYANLYKEQSKWYDVQNY